MEQPKKEKSIVILNQEQRSQLDTNIKNMLNAGATQDDVTAYANDFKAKFSNGVKKKETTQQGIPFQSSVTESDISKPQKDGSLASSESTISSDGGLVQQVQRGDFDKDIRQFKESELIQQGEINSLMDSYTDSVAINETDYAEAEETVKAEEQGDFGFFGNAKNAVLSTPRFGVFPNPFFNPSKVGNIPEKVALRKELAEERGVDVKDIDSVELNKEYNQKKTKDLLATKRTLKTEEFIENLSNEDKNTLTKEFRYNWAKLDIKSKELLLDTENLAKDLQGKTNELDSVIKEHNKDADYPEQYFIDNLKLGQEVKSMLSQYSSKLDELNKSQEDLSSVSEELDLFKRNYDKWNNFSTKATGSLANIGVNGIHFINEGTQAIKEATGVDFPLSNLNYLQIKDINDQTRANIQKDEEGLARRQTIDDIQGISDIEGMTEWALGTLADQTGSTVVLVASGGSSLAGNIGLGVLGLTSAGAKLEELEQEEKNSFGAINYSNLEKWSVATLSGVLEGATEKISLGQINKGMRVFKSAPFNEIKKSAGNYLRKNALTDIKSYAKDVSEEVISEVINDLGGKRSEQLILGKDVNYLEGLDETILSSAFMSGLVYKTPQIGNSIRKAFTTADVNQQIAENTEAIIGISNQLNSNITETSRVKLEEKKIQLANKNLELIDGTINNVDDLSKEDKAKLISINNEFFNTRKEYFDVRNDQTLKDDYKDALLKDIEKKGVALDEEKTSILNKEVAGETSETNVTQETKDFAEDLSENESDIEDISQYVGGNLKVSVGNTDVNLKSLDNGNIKIESIVTEDKDKRGQGSAKEALQKTTTVADNQGKTLELNVVPLDKETTVDGLISLYESEGFVKDKDFDKDDGGRMVREPQKSETQKGFDAIDSIIEEAQPKEEITETAPTTQNEIETNLNTYSVDVVDGELQITPKLGDAKPSKAEVKKVTDQYIESTDFTQGKKANLESKGNLTPEQVNDVVVAESQNPQEVAQQIISTNESNQDSTQALEVSKQGAIAQALQGVQVSKDSFAQTDDINNVPDVNPYYFNPLNKNIKGQSIDAIRESAQELTGEEVSLEDITNFIKEFRNPKDIAVSETSDTSELESKFQELTGLKPTPQNIEKVANIQTEQKQETETDQTTEDGQDVPFQTESTQTRIKGEELTNLVDRLKNTGLANDVKVLNNSQIEAKLNELGVDVQKQSEASEKDVNIIISNKKRTLFHSTNKNIRGDFKLRNRYGFYGVYFAGSKKDSKTFGDTTYKVKIEPKSTLIISDNEVKKYNFFNISEESYNEYISKGYDSLAWYQNGKLKEFVALDNSIVKDRDIQFQKTNESESQINGFVHDGTVYLNSDNVKADTPIHEFGHLWNSYLKENDNAHYQLGTELVRDSEYHEAVKNNPAYDKLDEEGQLEEALAQAIGEKGVKLLNESKKSKFATWFNTLFTKIAKGLGLTSLTGKQLSELTLDKYTDLVSAELVSGKQVVKKSKPKPKEVKTRVKEADITNIELVMTEVQAVKKTRDSLNKKFKAKKSFVKDVKKELVNYINSVLDTGIIKGANATEIKRIINTVRDTESKRIMIKSFDKVNKIIASIENKRIKSQIESIVKSPKTYLKKVSGRNKAKKIDNETRKIIVTANKWMKKDATDILDEINSLGSDLINNDLDVYTGLHIALDISNARQSELKYKDNKELSVLENSLKVNTSTLDTLDSLIKTGKSKLTEQIKKEASRLNNLTNDAVEATNHKDSGKTNLEKQQERFDKQHKWLKIFNKKTDGLKKINWAKATTFSFEYLMGYIDQVSNYGKGFLYNRFYSGKEGLIQKDKEFRQDGRDIQEDIKSNVESILGKKFNNFVSNYIHSKDLNKIKKTNIYLTDKKGEKTETPLALSLNQGLYVHLVSKMSNQNNQLREQGWNDDSFEQLDKFLGEKYVKLSDFLTNFLSDKYNKYNKTHLELLRTDLGFDEGYFPTKYEDVDLTYEFDLGGTNFTMASVMSKNMIEKIKNNNRIDITQNAFDILSEYLDSMETFHHYGRFTKDLNAVLNNKSFKNNVKVFDDRAYQDLLKLSKAIIGDKSDFNVDLVEKRLYGLNAAIASGYILFKGWTALKQFLSMPAYTEFAEMFTIKGRKIPLFHKTYFMTKMVAQMNPYHVIKNYKFLSKNSIEFRERMKRGNLGNEAIKELLDSKNRKTFLQKSFANLLSLGIAPNKLIDALTISTGGKVYYDQQYNKYLKTKMSKKDAHEQAIRDFEVGFKITQQSSDTANLSSVQIRKGALTALFVPFKNAQFGYFRRIMANKNNVTRRFKSEKQKLKNKGFTEKQAGVKAFKSVVQKADTWNEMSNILLYTTVLPVIWQYVASGLPAILTEWGDDDEAELKRALTIGPIDGLFIINDISKYVYNKTVLNKSWKFQEAIVLQEIENTTSDIKKASKDSGYFNEDVLLEIGKAYLKTKSIQTKTFNNIYEGVEDMIITKENPTMEDIFKILNAPKELSGS